VSNVTKATNPTPALPPDLERLQELVERAEKGDATTLPVLHQLLRDPAAVELFGGNLAKEAERALVSAAVETVITDLAEQHDHYAYQE
jgi:hypothetical protein